jgi:hypothetical protein
MTRSLLTCHTAGCLDPDTGRRTVLALHPAGRRTLKLSPAVRTFKVDLFTGRMTIACPSCGADRVFEAAIIKCGEIGPERPRVRVMTEEPDYHAH